MPLEIACSQQGQIEEIALGLCPPGFLIYPWMENSKTSLGSLFQCSVTLVAQKGILHL